MRVCELGTGVGAGKRYDKTYKSSKLVSHRSLVGKDVHCWCVLGVSACSLKRHTAQHRYVIIVVMILERKIAKTESI